MKLNDVLVFYWKLNDVCLFWVTIVHSEYITLSHVAGLVPGSPLTVGWHFTILIFMILLFYENNFFTDM